MNPSLISKFGSMFAWLKRLRFPWPLRLGISMTVLGFLLWLLPREELWRAFSRVPWSTWFVVLSVFLFGHSLAAMKWWLLFVRNGDLSPIVSLQAHFSGLFANLCLPGIAGGDVLRAAWVMRQADSAERVAIASLTDRLLDCLALLLLTACATLWLLGQSVPILIPLAAGAALVLCGIAALFGLHFVCRRFQKRGRLVRIATALEELRQRPWRLVGCLALSLAVQGTFVLLNAQLGVSAGVELALPPWFFAWPLAKLVAILPISVAGLGVRESTLVALLKPFGPSASSIMAAGLLWETILFSGGLLGGIVAVLGRRESKATLVSTEN